jgi:hypothetical protein
VTTPLVDTVAIASEPLDQLATRPVSVCPNESSGVAVSCCVPSIAMVVESGATVTLSTSPPG